MSLVHLAMRVPALGFAGLLVGGCMVVYPALVQANPTATKPNQVTVSCPYGGTAAKLKFVDPTGKSDFEWKCVTDDSHLTNLQKFYSPTIAIDGSP